MQDLWAGIRGLIRRDPALFAFSAFAVAAIGLAVAVWGLPRWLFGGAAIPYLISLLNRFGWARRPLFEPFATMRDRGTLMPDLYALGSRGFRVFPRIRTEAGFLDVLVVGPTGVFTIRTSAPGQEVVPGARGKDAVVTESGSAAAERAEAERAAVERVLRDSGFDVPVRALVVKAGKGSERWLGGLEHVDFVLPAVVVPRVTSGEQVLASHEVDRALRALLHVGSDAAGAPADPPADGELPDR